MHYERTGMNISGRRGLRLFVLGTSLVSRVDDAASPGPGGWAAFHQER